MTARIGRRQAAAGQRTLTGGIGSSAPRPMGGSIYYIKVSGVYGITTEKPRTGLRTGRDSAIRKGKAKEPEFQVPEGAVLGGKTHRETGRKQQGNSPDSGRGKRERQEARLRANDYPFLYNF